jgi:hypothetical protein
MKKNVLFVALMSLGYFSGCANTPIPDTGSCIQKSHLQDMAKKNLELIKQSNIEIKQSYAELGAYSKWLSTYFAGYSKYIEHAGTYSPVIKLIPFPYAGQAGDIIKFGSKLTLSITNAAVALEKASLSISKFEELQKNANSPEAIDTAARFADEKLMPDIKDALVKNEALKDASLGLLGFAESIEKVSMGTQDALLKAKSLFTKDDEEKEQIQKVAVMKQKLEQFKIRLSKIDEAMQKNSALAKRTAIYAELAK